MADLFTSEAQASRKSPSLHSDTEIYFAVEKLGAYLLSAISHIQKGMKMVLGEALLFEASEMAKLVRKANIARGEEKLPFLEQLLESLEGVKYTLRSANASGHLPHKTYANSIPITDSIGKQAQGLKNRYAPAPSPVA